jgi:hypothetical protein
VFFFEKKNQKTFVPVRTLPASFAAIIKSFLLLFFKKEDSFLLRRLQRRLHHRHRIP